MNTDNMTKEEKEELLISQLREYTNYVILKEFDEGKEPKEETLRMIDRLKIKYKMNEEVMNVAIYYVMLRAHNKLTESYLEKVSAHWSSLNINTAREAMDIAKKMQKEDYEKKYKDDVSLASLALENEILQGRVEGLERDVYTLQEQLKQFRKAFDELIYKLS